MDTLEIIRQLQNDPALKAELRAFLLGEEVLSLPELVKENSRQIAALTDRVEHMNEQIAENSCQIAALTDVIKAHDERLVRMENRLGNLDGKFTEESYRKNFATKVWNVEEGSLRIKSVLDAIVLGEVLDNAVDKAFISTEEASEVIVADVVAEGRIRSTGELVTVVAEVSNIVHIDDILRAIRRAEIAGRATKRRSIPVMMGEKADVIKDASYPGVWLIEKNQTRQLLGDIS